MKVRALRDSSPAVTGYLMKLVTPAGGAPWFSSRADLVSAPNPNWEHGLILGPPGPPLEGDRGGGVGCGACDTF